MKFKLFINKRATYFNLGADSFLVLLEDKSLLEVQAIRWNVCDNFGNYKMIPQVHYSVQLEKTLKFNIYKFKQIALDTAIKSYLKKKCYEI